ncbi:hypothetical protein [Streptomyces sp. NPDC052107]|uniref:hypothetical protein n=1 Tax=Streptomyces sp. NPDC052107 TaxID=3155632 RepID=UPI003412F299
MTARLGQMAAAMGVGLAAGLVGTLAMTLSSTVKVRGRQSSSAPADAAGKLLGAAPVDERGRARFSSAVHYGYGTAWGAARGLLAALGVPPAVASTVHMGLVWASEMIALPALGVAPPATEWGTAEIAVDGWHHLVYATATGAAYNFMDKGTGCSWSRPG